MIWQELHNPVVRDLAWACFSPPLLLSPHLESGSGDIENCQLALTAGRSAHLRQLDSEPGPLLAYLAENKQSRLGIYFERLWHFYLTTDPDVELLAHNLPVREGGRTLGEFDILYLCKKTRRHIHLELAVKFYLGVPGTTIWLGPGQRDQLDRKVRHMTRKQIRLGAQAPAQALLDDLGIASLNRQIELKGYLFQPLSASPAPPPGYNPVLPLSHWYSIDQFRALPPPETGWLGWQPIRRVHWLSPLCVAEAEPVLNHAAVLAQLEESFNKGAGPRLLACCDEFGQEKKRGFVTPLAWPSA